MHRKTLNPHWLAGLLHGIIKIQPIIHTHAYEDSQPSLVGWLHFHPSNLRGQVCKNI